MYAKIIVDLPTTEVDELYTYIVPKDIQENIYPGSRVYVEFGFQKVLGYVLELVNELDFVGNLKEIIEVIDFEHGLNNEQIELAKTLAKDLLVPLTTTLSLMYPSFMRSRINKRINILNYDNLDAELALLLGNKKSIPITNKIISKYNKIKKEIENGNLEIVTNIYTYGKTKLVKYYSLKNYDQLPDTEKRQLVIKYLESVNEASGDEIKENTGVSDFIINKLVETKYLNVQERLPQKEVKRKLINYAINKDLDYEMAMNKFSKIEGKPYLLYSNDNKFKDDFLIESSLNTIRAGKQVLIVTPTILENIRVTKLVEEVIDKNILSFSSKLSSSEYYFNYNQLVTGNVDLVITTKSGIFLPLENIGLIILLDSEEKYYLNEFNPKYSTLEVLKLRSQYQNAKLILATSSPSIEQFYNYYTNKFTIISNYKLPKINNIHLINMQEEYLSNLLSESLTQGIKESLKLNKISVLLLNSLAYNQTILCSECMKTILCPNCQIGLFYHKNKNNYQCSSCNYQSTKPTCSCGAQNYSHFGYGLELLKEVLEKQYRSAKILQVDSESFATEADYEELFVAIEENEVDIIIGTYPLISLNHPDINLIGLINIDSLLMKNDYRSSEEAYQLITKLVSNFEANVYIQGYNLDHYSIKDAMNGSYDEFFNKELEIRKNYHYPPFNEISRLLIIGEYRDMYYFANYFKKVFARMSSMNILGPVYIPRIKGVQLIIKYEDFPRLARLIEEVKKKFSDKKLFVNFERYPLSFN